MTIAVVADHIITTDNEYDPRCLIEPDIAKNVTQQWFDRDGVDMTVENLNSAVALAVQALGKEKKSLEDVVVVIDNLTRNLADNGALPYDPEAAAAAIATSGWTSNGTRTPTACST